MSSPDTAPPPMPDASEGQHMKGESVSKEKFVTEYAWLLDDGTRVVFYSGAPWCKPCVRADPVVMRVMSGYSTLDPDRTSVALVSPQEAKNRVHAVCPWISPEEVKVPMLLAWSGGVGATALQNSDEETILKWFSAVIPDLITS